MAHQAWPGTTTGHSKHSSESEESEDEQRATEDDEEHEDEGDGDDECQGGVLGHRRSRSCHLNLNLRRQQSNPIVEGQLVERHRSVRIEPPPPPKLQG